MVFSSLPFICIFLPVVFVLSRVIRPLKAQNVLLAAASLLFYAYGEPVYVLLMLGSALANYAFARVIGGQKTAPAAKKAAVILAVALNLGVLGVFKYADFAVSTLNGVAGLSLKLPGVALPIGISFFTFQALSYVIDVYRGDVPAERSFLNVLLYISFFPQLIAGPIVKYHDISAALSARVQSPELASDGLRRFIVGLGKKVLIANVMGQTADAVFSAPDETLNVLLAWLGAAAYMLQIYYDFSGYSDMAIGLGKLFGFSFKENFNYPYSAVSMQDFWRRWHISMSTWFKEYLYIPLGGNRKGKARTALNRVIVFFCTGLWHGANWTFVVWGLYHGFFLLLETYVPAFKKLPGVLGRVYAWLVVCVGFVIFRADTLAGGISFVGKMFGGFTFGFQSKALLLRQLTPWFIAVFIAAALGAGLLEKPLQKARELLRGETKPVFRYVGWALSVLLLIWCVIRLSGQSYNPFIYFRF